jgi:hypothetical protein
MVLTIAKKCSFCKEYLDDGLRRQNRETPKGDQWIVPVGRPASAILAGYAGLFAVLPIFHLFALLFGIIAVNELKAKPEMLGKGRAYFGLGMGVVFTLLYIGLFTIVAMSGPSRR